MCTCALEPFQLTERFGTHMYIYKQFGEAHTCHCCTRFSSVRGGEGGGLAIKCANIYSQSPPVVEMQVGVWQVADETAKEAEAGLSGPTSPVSETPRKLLSLPMVPE